ncbi:hypothetical protein J2S11_002128 [Bacillus horti]|uniref:Uncharacterized protein n=1 Tax=Caldalkalibacillus horti TaxID=77523 RepID=A0ABT9VZ26_9BACI|nr:hypothetical protein [Bacillus horti]
MNRPSTGMTYIQEHLWISHAIFSIACAQRDTYALFTTCE